MLVVCVPILALVLLLSVVLREPVEPVYRGKKLSEWAEQYTLRRSVDEESERAILAIGTNGLPCMLRWLPQARDRASERKSKWLVRIWRLPRPIQAMFLRLPGVRNWNWQSRPTTPSLRALACFEILKKDGAPALPTLVQFAKATEDSETALSAIMAMSLIGADAVPMLYAMVTNREYANRPRAAAALGEIREAGESHEVVVALLDCFREKDIALARSAGDALGRLTVEPELAIPALIEGLKDPNLKFTCVRSLGRFGPAAKAAMIPLQQALQEPNQPFKNEILEVLGALAPDLTHPEQ